MIIKIIFGNPFYCFENVKLMEIIVYNYPQNIRVWYIMHILGYTSQTMHTKISQKNMYVFMHIAHRQTI